MEEVLVPATRMIANYFINGVLGPKTAAWKARKEAEARKIAARGEAEVLEIQNRSTNGIPQGNWERVPRSG